MGVGESGGPRIDKDDAVSDETQGDLVFGKSTGDGTAKPVATDDDGHVQVDILSGGAGGTEYTEGDTDTTITGGALLFETDVSTSALGVLSTDNPAPVQGPVSEGDNHGTNRPVVVGGVQSNDDVRHWDMDSTGRGSVNANTQQGDADVSSTNPLFVNGPQMDDAAFASGTDFGFPIMGHFDDMTPNAVDENDAGAIRCSNNRNLYTTIRDGAGGERGATVRDLTNADPLDVSIVDASGDQITSFGGGTQYTEDAAAAADPVGTAQILVRQDTPAGIASADGDNVARRGTDYGAAFSQILDSSGNFVDSFGGGTQYTEGDIDASLTGTVAMAEGPSDTATPLQVDASKHLQVDIAADSVGIGGGEQHEDGETVSVGDKGTVAVGHDGTDYQFIKTDTGGELQVDVLSSALPTGAATSALQTTQETTLDAIQAAVEIMDDWDDGADNAKVVGNVAHDAADSGNPVKMGGKAFDMEPDAAGLNQPTPVAAGDRSHIYTGLNGRELRPQPFINYYVPSDVVATYSTSTTVTSDPIAWWHYDFMTLAFDIEVSGAPTTIFIEVLVDVGDGNFIPFANGHIGHMLYSDSYIGSGLQKCFKFPLSADNIEIQVTSVVSSGSFTINSLTVQGS